MNPEQGPARRRRAAIVPVLVIALFVLPIVVAWWLAGSDAPLQSGELVNHGTLVHPPLDINADAASRSLGRIPLAVSEWAVIFVTPGVCDEACEKHVSLLSTIRSLLGQDGTRVHVVALVDTATGATSGFTVVADADARAWISTGLTGRLDAAAERSVVFLDWRGQIMMYFTVEASPADIKADLKRLLRASAIR